MPARIIPLPEAPEQSPLEQLDPITRSVVEVKIAMPGMSTAELAEVFGFGNAKVRGILERHDVKDILSGPFAEHAQIYVHNAEVARAVIDRTLVPSAIRLREIALDLDTGADVARKANVNVLKMGGIPEAAPEKQHAALNIVGDLTMNVANMNPENFAEFQELGRKLLYGEPVDVSAEPSTQDDADLPD